MTSLQNTASVAALGAVQRIQLVKGLPGSYCLKVKVQVLGSATLDHAMKNGAPNTPFDTIQQINGLHQIFPPTFSGYAHKEVLLVSFGKFMHQKSVEAFTTEVKEKHKLSDLEIRTMLAVGDDHRMFCRERGIRRMRLVCLSRKVRHLDLWHVPTLRQENHNDCVTNTLVLEPYEYGWGVEHVFGFERTISQ